MGNGATAATVLSATGNALTGSLDSTAIKDGQVDSDEIINSVN